MTNDRPKPSGSPDSSVRPLPSRPMVLARLCRGLSADGLTARRRWTESGSAKDSAHLRRAAPPYSTSKMHSISTAMFPGKEL